MATKPKPKISYPLHGVVRVEVPHPDGEPRTIVRANRFQAVVDAAKAIREANDFATSEPTKPTADDKYIQTLRNAVANNDLANKLLEFPAVDQEVAASFNLVDAVTHTLSEMVAEGLTFTKPKDFEHIKKFLDGGVEYVGRPLNIAEAAGINADLDKLAKEPGE